MRYVTVDEALIICADLRLNVQTDGMAGLLCKADTVPFTHIAYGVRNLRSASVWNVI